MLAVSSRACSACGFDDDHVVPACKRPETVTIEEGEEEEEEEEEVVVSASLVIFEGSVSSRAKEVVGGPWDRHLTNDKNQT